MYCTHNETATNRSDLGFIYIYKLRVQNRCLKGKLALRLNVKGKF